MKLSEAIRLGAMLKPQIKQDHYHNGSTCAFGAALDAVGQLSMFISGDKFGELDYNHDAYHKYLHSLFDDWRVHNVDPFVLPNGEFTINYEGHKNEFCVIYLIVKLNDDFDFTREAIADHLNKLELLQLQTVEKNEPILVSVPSQAMHSY